MVERIVQDVDDDEPEPDEPGHAMTMNAGAARADAARKERSSERALRLADLLAFAQRCSTVGCSERSQGIGPENHSRKHTGSTAILLISLGIGQWKI